MTSTANPAGGSLTCRSRRRWRLGEVLLLTAPPVLLVLYVFGASVLDYHALSQYDDWWSRQAHVHRFLKFRLSSLARLPRAMALDQRLSVEDTTRPKLDLRVDRLEWDRLESDAAQHWGESVDAWLVDGRDFQRVELRPRGDTSVHWTAEKKTLSVRTGRGNLFKDNRTTVFSAKDVLPQYLANSLAKDFGLLAPATAVVPVYLNQRFYGMHRVFAPLDEGFLRRAVRIPGNIFRGDTAERGEYFKGLPRELFLNPYIWDRVANNDRPGAIGTAKLFEFIGALNGSTFEEHEHLLRLLDRNELSKLLALELAVGDPFHMSGVHNQFWYEDSSSGLLHPIPWDLRLLDLQHPPPNSAFNRFWRSALRDPRIFADALATLHRWREDDQLYRMAESRVNAAWELHRDAFEFDRLRTGAIADVGSPDEALRTLRGNLDELARWADDARVAYAATPQSDGTCVFDCVVGGRAPVLLSLRDTGSRADAVVQLFADSNRNGVFDSADRRFVESDELIPACEVGAGLTPAPLSYRFFARTAGASVEFANALTGRRIEPTPLKAGEALPSAASWHPWQYREPELREVELSGEVHLTETLGIPRNTTLRIAAGTHIRLDPDVSVHAEGLVLAEGTAERPILFENAVPSEPWGSLAMQGSGCDDSRFTHVRFTGGGGALLDEVEYTGMVCVHWARGVSFEDCEFAGNLRCDDAFHADVAEVALLRCYIHDTNADAVDYDMSGGVIQGCVVERTGNDGFDLMTCWPRIIDNTIRNCGDKGISVGESSTPFVFANTITGCVRGMEIKDRSQPVILHNRITKNGVGIMARLKNWRYGRAGWPKVVRSVVSDNVDDLVLEPKSAITELGAQIGASDAMHASDPSTLADLNWLFAENGIDAPAAAAGTITDWRARAPSRVVDREDFPARWEVPRQRWSSAGDVTALDFENDDLIVRMGHSAGRVSQARAWDLSDPTRRCTLVLELSGEELREVRVIVARDGETLDTASVSQRCELGTGPGRYAYTAVSLPAGRYREFALQIEPRSARGELHVHGWRVLAAAPPEGDR